MWCLKCYASCPNLFINTSQIINMTVIIAPKCKCKQCMSKSEFYCAFTCGKNRECKILKRFKIVPTESDFTKSRIRVNDILGPSKVHFQSPFLECKYFQNINNWLSANKAAECPEVLKTKMNKIRVLVKGVSCIWLEEKLIYYVALNEKKWSTIKNEFKRTWNCSRLFITLRFQFLSQPTIWLQRLFNSPRIFNNVWAWFAETFSEVLLKK